MGANPGACWEMNFTEVRPGKFDYRYLLVLVDTFSGWTKAYPTRHEMIQTAMKQMLDEGFPGMECQPS